MREERLDLAQAVHMPPRIWGILPIKLLKGGGT